MKKLFETPEMEITKFDVTDVLTTSSLSEMDSEVSGVGGSTNFGNLGI